MRNTFSISAIVLSATLSCLILGCQPSGPQIGHVKGRVTLNGEPAKEAQVFFDIPGGRSSFAFTDADGNYELYYSGKKMGAVVGIHTIRISTAVDPTVDDSGKVTVPAIKETLPAEYRDGSISREVKPGENVINFEI